MRYAALIGAIACILDAYQYIGAIAGWLPAFLIALFTNGLANALFVSLEIAPVAAQTALRKAPRTSFWTWWLPLTAAAFSVQAR